MSNQPRRRGPMGGGHGRMGTGEKAKDFKGTMKKLFTYLSEYKIGIFFVMIFAIGSTVFNIIGPKVLGKATTEIFKGLVGKVSGASTHPLRISFFFTFDRLIATLCPA